MAIKIGKFFKRLFTRPGSPKLSNFDLENADQEAARLVYGEGGKETNDYFNQLIPSTDEDSAQATQELRERGEDLSNVDQDYMNRAYEPAFNRLMQSYNEADQGILENMNRRGIASVPGGFSEPEAYQRGLLNRNTKQTMANTMLDAQNQAVQQKLAQYNSRLAEPQQADVRIGQVGAKNQQRLQTAANISNSRLGLATNAYNTNSQQYSNMLGAGLGVGAGALAMMSDPAKKKNRVQGPDPEQDLQEMTDTPVDRWQYRWEDDSEPMHEGAMMDEAPIDTQVPGGIDIPSYLGKLTNSVKALNQKMSAYERLLSQGGQTNGL